MSAILGRVDLFDAPVDREMFRAAFDICAHYGGDGSGSIVNGPVALGQHFRRVARRAVDERQPVRLGPLSLVADAIIDNRPEVIEALDLDPVAARSLADGDLILRAYRAWGTACLDRLEGDYAFAVWNSEQHRLFLARDHIGARPLFWRMKGTTVVFGSDVRSLHAMSDLGWDVDQTAVIEYLRWPLEPVRRGFFRGLCVCPPGGKVTIDRQGAKEARWWDPAEARQETYRTSDDYAERLDELLERAVAARVDTDLRIGCHISGGVDSTAVAVVAHRQLSAAGRGLGMAYAWAPPISENYPDLGSRDERHRIAQVAEREGFGVRWGTADGCTLLQLLEHPIEFEGTADLAEEIATIRNAAADGVGVMLSGWGGDEGFSAPGFGYAAMLLRQARFRTLLSFVRRELGIGGRRAQLRYLWNEAVRRNLPASCPLSFERSFASFDATRFLREEIRRSLGLAHHAIATRLALPAHPNRYLHALILHGHLSARMDSWTAWSAGASITYRYPLTCRKVLSFSAQLPSNMYALGGRPRFLARRIATRIGIETPSKTDLANEYARRVRRSQFDRQADQRLEPALRGSMGRYFDATKLSSYLRDASSEKVEGLRSCHRFMLLRVLHLLQAEE